MPALEGMLRAHYLLADHRGLGAALPGEIRQKRDEVPNALRMSYQRGVSLLKAVQGLNRDVLKADLAQQADDYLRLGDWSLWIGNRAAAFDYYDAALAIARGEQPHLKESPAKTKETQDNGAALPTLVDEADTTLAATDTPLKSPEPSAVTGQSLSLSSGDAGEATIANEPPPSPRSDMTTAVKADLSLSDSETAVPNNAPVSAAAAGDPLFAILGDIVQLPNVPGFGPVLPVKTEGVTEEDLIVSFNINEVGKVVNIERIQLPEVETLRGPERVIRRLRATRFRPIFKGDKPVASDTITLAFDKSLWARSTIE